MKTSRDSCSDQVSGMPRALLMNSDAIVRYIAVPSRLNEYPVGTTIPTTGRETPRCSIFAMSRGSAVSDDEVATISRYSWRR